jgi:hypothetical protein
MQWTPGGVLYCRERELLLSIGRTLLGEKFVVGKEWGRVICVEWIGGRYGMDWWAIWNGLVGDMEWIGGQSIPPRRATLLRPLTVSVRNIWAWL